MSPDGQGTGMVDGQRKWSSWVPNALCLGSVSQSIAKSEGGKRPLPSWSWAPSSPLSSASPLPSALSLPYVSPALGSAPCLIKQPQMLKTQCLFYFIFLHTCITPRQATPGIGLFVWFYFVAFREKKGREKRRNNTNHPALEAVSGQAVGSGF